MASAPTSKRVAGAILAALALALAGLGAMLVEARPAARARVALVTSLPLLMGEGFGLDLDKSAAPLADVLRKRLDLVPIGVTEAGELRGHRVLLMLHPHAQTARGLVDLDEWVRGGGRLLLTADPRLDFDSVRPLGDRLRPPPSFADTGLLDHWGLVMHDGGDGAARFSVKPGASGCRIARDGRRADCRIGKGRLILLGDSDPVMAEPKDKGAKALLSAIDEIVRA